MKILNIKGYDVLLDDEDWLRLCYYKWKIRTQKSDIKQIYFCRNTRIKGKGHTIYLHRAIMSPPNGLNLDRKQEVHHKNNNTLDNRKENLEIVLRREHNYITHKR